MKIISVILICLCLSACVITSKYDENGEYIETCIK